MASTFWLYSHNFTNSGAPLVLAAIARELAAAGWRDQIKIVSWGGLHDQRHSELQFELMKQGICCQILEACQSPPKPKKGDLLLLNSLALPEHVICQSLEWAAKRRLSRLYWYAHEFTPNIFLPGSLWPGKIKKALESDYLKLCVPSFRTLVSYQNWLSYSGEQLVVQNPTTLVFANLIGKIRDDFSELRFQLVGAVGSGQKGHLWLLQLIEKVLVEAPINTHNLRNIRLQFIGIESGPYAALARVVCQRASDLLGDRFSWVGQCSREQAWQAMLNSNFAISCSAFETFSMAAAEAMQIGHPLLRNRTGGWEEQLTPGQNGFDLGLPSPIVHPSQVALIQEMRDPIIYSSSDFKQMSKHSIHHSLKLASQSLLSWLK